MFIIKKIIITSREPVINCSEKRPFSDNELKCLDSLFVSDEIIINDNEDLDDALNRYEDANPKIKNWIHEIRYISED